MADDDHDDHEDEGPKAPKKRPRRDPNKPYPKAKPKRRLILKTAAAAVVALAIVWTTGYSMKIGKPPWEWGQEDAEGLKGYVEDQVSEAKQNIENIDWGKFGEETKKLWNKVPALEKKLEDKLASLRSKREDAKPKADTTAGGSDGATQEPATVPPPEPTNLELGCEALRDGVRHYKKSLDSQKQLKLARKKFETAQVHLDAAYNEAETDAEREEIAGYQQLCQQYLYDCMKLEKVG